MNVTGKARTPAVITTSGNVCPRMVIGAGSVNAIKNLPAIASAITRAARKTPAQAT
jgi:hypothetical protein